MSATDAVPMARQPVAGLRTHLELGRVSNLPTVWSNVLAAFVLAGHAATAAPLPALLWALFGFSALYIGGMYLNDACDADIDARERPERPIPSGRIARSAVRQGAVAWFIAGVGAIAAARVLSPDAAGSVAWLSATLALIATIALYDRHHKGNPFGPLLMAACRALVYLGASLAFTGSLPGAVLLGAALVFAWTAGLTAFAKREAAFGGADDRGNADAGAPGTSALGELASWPFAVLMLPVAVAVTAMFAGAGPASIVLLLCIATVAIALHARRLMHRRAPGDFPAAIGLLIAAMALVDALAIARAGAPGLALLAAACAWATVMLQRRVAGT